MEKNLILVVAAVSITKFADCATDPPAPGKPDYLVYPYCFRFTWLGPKYDGNSIIGNATCSTILEDAKDIPCKLPLIATNNSNTPDTDWLWEHYKSRPTEIACRLSRGDVCVKYSYIYNKAVQNITYMCTKVTVDGEGPARIGTCYWQIENGKEVEVCVCESSVGAIPCNTVARNFNLSSGLAIAFGIVVLFQWNRIMSRIKFGT